MGGAGLGVYVVIVGGTPGMYSGWDYPWISM